jgi:hypothetical protein
MGFSSANKLLSSFLVFAGKWTLGQGLSRRFSIISRVFLTWYHPLAGGDEKFSVKPVPQVLQRAYLARFRESNQPAKVREGDYLNCLRFYLNYF